jgi:hypothetical protein
MKADLEGASKVTLRRDCNLCLNIRNPLSDFEVRDKILVNPSVFVEQDEHSREPPHHFALKWEGNKKTSTMTVLTPEETKTAMKKKSKKGQALDDLLPGSYTLDHSGDFAPILAVECRGLEPTIFHPGNEFVVESEGGTTFSDDTVDLSEGDWAEYDADHDSPVSISSVEFKWEAF